MWPTSISLIVLEAFVAAFGLFFNSYILVILFWQKRFHNVHNLLLLHLAIVDSLFCLNILFGNTSLGLTIGDHFDHIDDYLSANHSQTLYLLVLQAQGFIWTLLPIIFIWTLFGLTWDKYIAISSPFCYSSLINAKKALIFIVTTWSFAIIICVSPSLGECLYIYSIHRSTSSISCDISASSKKEFTLFFIIIYFLFSFIIPLTAIIVCNFRILLIAQDHRTRITSSLIEIIQRSQLDLPLNKDYLNCKKSWNAFLPISQLIGSLILFALPYYLIFFIESLNFAFQLPSFIISMSTLCLCFIPTTNAYIYGVQSKTLRNTLKSLIMRYLYKQNVSYEIDRRLSIRSHSSLVNLNRFPRRYTYPILASISQPKLNTDLTGSHYDKFYRC